MHSIKMLAGHLQSKYTNFRAKCHWFARRFKTLVVSFNSNDALYPEDDEFLGLNAYKMAAMKWSSPALAYQAIYRFPNDRGAIVLRSAFAGDPWEVIPISFMPIHGKCWYFTVTGNPELINCWGAGYRAYDRVIALLGRTMAMPALPETDLTVYFSTTKEADRLYPRKWLREVTASPEFRRKQ